MKSISLHKKILVEMSYIFDEDGKLSCKVIKEYFLTRPQVSTVSIFKEITS